MSDISQYTKNLNTYTSTYYQMRNRWIEQLDFFEPTHIGNTNGSVLSRYLYPHPAEDKSEFAGRAQRIVQLNLLKHIISFYISILFSTEIEIKSKKFQEEVDSFVNECNTRGESLIHFLKTMVCPSTFLHGTMDVFIDLPRPDRQPDSLLDENMMGLRPYCYAVPCLNRVRWNIDNSYNYSYYQSRDVISREVSTQFNIEHKEMYKIWTPENVYTYDLTGNKKIEEKNPYGFIPAVNFTALSSVRFFEDKLGVPLTDGIVEIQKEIMNSISLRQQWNREQTFSTLVVTQDQDAMGELPTEGESKEIGTNRMLTLQGKGSHAGYISPDAALGTTLMVYVNELIDRAFELMLIPSDANSVKSHTTGSGIKVAMGQLYDRMVDIAGTLEIGIKNLIGMALRVQGIDPREAGLTVKWNVNFSNESFIVGIQQLQALRAAAEDISPTAIREYMKRMIGSELYPSQKITEIEKEIDSWDGNSTEDVEAQKSPIVSKEISDAANEALK